MSGKEPPKEEEGNFIKSEITAIGALRCNSTGLSFYNNFINIDIANTKNLNRDFGNNWKEVIIKLSNHNTEIIKYLENNY